MFMAGDCFSTDANLAEFSRPVESIMKCEDFKSNFARRLSNRYIARTPAACGLKKEGLKQPVSNKKQEVNENVPESAEPVTEHIEKIKTNLSEEAARSLDAAAAKQDAVKSAEVAALNMEVETLKWQLAQTETNRQMHLALLKRIVSFLNRVKEHMEIKKEEVGDKEELNSRVLPMSVDLPRSRSVLHFSKNLDCSLGPGKKLNSKKISKSITNVNGFKESSIIWNQSKVSLSSEDDCSKKITEEISRLIILANTVLSTKLPDLTCSCNSSDNFKISRENLQMETVTEIYKTQIIEGDSEVCGENITKCPPLCAIDNNNYSTAKIVTDDEKIQDGNDSLIVSMIDVDTDFNFFSKDEEETISVTPKKFNERTDTKLPHIIRNKNEFNRVSIFMEDESGFSSMSSFQEIGIPIINVIPPTPCKEDVFLENNLDIPNETDGWKNIPLGINNQAVKVFWV